MLSMLELKPGAGPWQALTTATNEKKHELKKFITQARWRKIIADDQMGKESGI